MSNEKEEPLIPLFPETDFQKLLFALKYIEFLKEENQLLQDEINALNSDLIKLGKDGKLLVQYKRELKETRAKYAKWRNG